MTLQDLRLELVEPDGPATVEEWFSPLWAADQVDWPDDPSWFLYERVALLHQPGVRSYVLGLARLGGAVAGCFQVRMSLRENLETADLEVYVDPAWRGRGVGRTLLGAAERIAGEHGRPIVAGTAEAPLGSPELERQARFARAAGYVAALEEARRELALPVDPSLLDALEGEARTRAAGYRLVSWTGPCPEEWVTGRVQVERSMSDAPRGDLDTEPEDLDVARLRQFEEVVAAMDRAAIATGAIAPQDAFVGFTEILVPNATPLVAYQFDTAVVSAHRGHRLGLLLKVANVRALQEHFPSTRRIITDNAVPNIPMIRVNEQLGFRQTGEGIVWQKRLA